MLNREIYLKDPSTIKLANEGVANVNDEKTDQALKVLRYELETFVCDGQYEKGLNHILETYLNNIDQAQQPSVWISGFYGSGKSHLAKMLRALWLDTEFPDGAKARGIANLPQSIRDNLKELSTQAKRHGGLHAASGTLGSGVSNVRLALLGIVFKSLGLPELYQKAKFVMWLKKEGIYEKIKTEVEADDKDFDFEIDNFYVSDVIHDALMKEKPNVFVSHDVCMETLNNLYPSTDDITVDEVVKTLREALTINGTIPLTVIILDEMQQYIGESGERSLDVMETIEMCSKNIGGKLLIVATGQSAIIGTAMLKKLEGRFTIPVQLSDNDVDTVIRKVFLAKNPEALPIIDKLYKENIGEISRHLSSTTIAHNIEDDKIFNQDYPILPVRRRFWEEALRVLDQTGTDSQLRNQLTTIHKAIKTNLDKKIGHVIPADFLYFDSATKLVQARLLPSKAHRQISIWMDSEKEDERLLARACGLIFLINKISTQNPELGLNAVADTIADLMLEDISTNSGQLRGKLPKLLDNCSLLMKVKDEYRIQTEESVAWNLDFTAQKSSLSSSPQIIDSDREEQIKQRYSAHTKGLNLLQGAAKVHRDVQVYHGSSAPTDHREKLFIWLRHGWNVGENSAKVDARQLGNESPLVTVYLPKKNSDAIRNNLIELRAAENTLRMKGTPNTTEGLEARAAIETIKNNAELNLEELFQELYQAALIIQAGGTEINENGLKSSLETALNNSLQRLYQKFSEADDSRWGKVFEKAMKGAPDALSSIDYTGEIASHPVCKAILSYIGNGKKGDQIRKQFDLAPYGWPRDAIDGALIALLVAGNIKALDERNQLIDKVKLERRSIGKAIFKSETVVLSPQQLLRIRKLYQKLGIQCPPGKELEHSEGFIHKLSTLTDQAGGEAPLPQKPEANQVDEIKLCSGNEKLMAIYNSCDDLSELIDISKSTADGIAKRLPDWQLLMGLISQAEELAGLDGIRSQIKQIKDQRLLLADPNPITPVIADLSQKLRVLLNEMKRDYERIYSKGLQSLSQDINWKRLEPGQQTEIMKANQIHASSAPQIELKDASAILQTLNDVTINFFQDRIAALPSRFDKALEDAAKLLEPSTQVLKLPSRTLKNSHDVDAWLADVKAELNKALQNGPVIVQ